MENCQGILFLTTNRIGSFDDAFVSRIHISLYYRDFTEDDRLKVWKTFFDKLARDRKNVMDVPAETILYTTEPEVKGLKWNGREIRNGERDSRLPHFGTSLGMRRADFRCNTQHSKQRLPSPISTAQTRTEKLSCARRISSRLCICLRSSRTTSNNYIVETRRRERIGSAFGMTSLMQKVEGYWEMTSDAGTAGSSSQIGL